MIFLCGGVAERDESPRIPNGLNSGNSARPCLEMDARYDSAGRVCQTRDDRRLAIELTKFGCTGTPAFLSPFAPDVYAVVGTLRLLILVVPEIQFTRLNVMVLGLVWLALNIIAPLGPGLP